MKKKRNKKPVQKLPRFQVKGFGVFVHDSKPDLETPFKRTFFAANENAAKEMFAEFVNSKCPEKYQVDKVEIIESIPFEEIDDSLEGRFPEVFKKLRAA